jgi:outer membrane protein
VLAASAEIAAGREALRGVEGDLLVDLIAAYADVRRDAHALRIRETNVLVLQATLDEVIARREAGELTRTDIAQAETQLQSADVQLNAARAQLESSRSTFTALVGREPRRLAPEPDLPLLPSSINEAIDTAAQFNPDLAAAIATERASRARIASARSESNPTLSLRGTAGTTGPLSPFDRRDQDVSFAGRATLTIPLLAGGRINALVNQASNRNSADFLRIEAARRQMVRAIVSAWNQWITSDRNVGAQDAQLKAARIYYEGTFEEYREGLRSTFDVLFAQNSLRETEIALLGSKRDRYVAQASLLRQIGQLEVAKLITGNALADPAIYTQRVMRRSALPWDGAVRALDAIDVPRVRPQMIERLPAGTAKSQMATPAALPVSPELATSGAALAKPMPDNAVQTGKQP